MPRERLSVVVSFHADDKRQLLREVLLPAAREVAEAMDRAGERPVSYLERHWLRGPHVRWVFGDTVHEPTAAARAEELERALRTAPSRSPVTPEAYLRLSAGLGRTELIGPPYGPIRPDNTATAQWWGAPTTAALLGEGALELKEHYFTAALRPLEAALDNGAPLLANALTTMVANAAASPFGGLLGGQLSYRSHLEDFLATNDPRGVVREGFAARLKDLREPLGRRLEELDAGRQPTAEADPLARSWQATLQEVWVTADRLAGERRILEDHGPAYLERAAGFDAEVERLWRFGADRPVSRMHARLGELDKARPRVRTVEFAAYRHVTNLMIRWLSLLGITPLERYFLSYAISELVLERHGLTLGGLLDRFSAAGGPHTAGTVAAS